jgi:2-polyprenyl-3-methyl-5-hydroxy-6-metoxy-1,4-benzoquinol methylase
VRVDPLPSAAELAEHYERSYGEGGYAVFSSATEIRRAIARERLTRVMRSARGSRWLDVGCAGGEFLEAARGAGLAIEGIDLSRRAVASARERGLDAHCTRVEDFRPDRPYDTVTAFDVIEHSLDPRGFVRSVASWLAPHGRLVLALPDAGSVYPRLLMGRHWFYYTPREHLYYFDRRTIGRLLREGGFRVTRLGRSTKPLSLAYSAASLGLFNRRLGAIAAGLARAVPRPLSERRVPLYLGEMWVESAKESG